MADYKIESSVSSARALIQSAPSSGVFNGDITYSPESKDKHGNLSAPYCCISNTTASEAQFQAAIDSAQPGTIMTNKTQRIIDAERKTPELLVSGFTFQDTLDETKGPIEVSTDKRTELRNLRLDVSDLIISMPQYTAGLNGRSALMESAADLDSAYEALIARGVYVIGDQVNGDGSMGEALLIVLIVQAVDQSALDAIVDTRI
jgi:hypothetical protein